MANDIIKQLQIIHLSDLHFGEKNIFNSEISPDGDRLTEDGHVSMFQKLREDLIKLVNKNPTILVITGDLTEQGDFVQYQKFEKFLKELLDDGYLNKFISKDNTFIVPGNHDMFYLGGELATRTHSWIEFMERFRGINIPLPKGDVLFPLIEVLDRSEDLGAIIVTLNSSIYVAKDTQEEERGRLGDLQKLFIENEIRKIPPDRLKGSIRIALVHHHPILIPQFAESKKGYDAIVDSAGFLSTLKYYGFHLILHGHKHHPLIFTCDTKSGFEDVESKQMTFIAGGSLGSTEFQPGYKNPMNTYNFIKICWNPKVSQSRINITTRALEKFGYRGRPLLTGNWDWKTVCLYDESYSGNERFPKQFSTEAVSYSSQHHKELDDKRKESLRQTRGYFPVYEARPSFDEKGSYEAFLWLEYYGIPTGRQKGDIPKEVIWFKDKESGIRRVKKSKFNTSFAIRLNYETSFLMHVKLIFPDRFVFHSDIFIRLPN